MCLLFPGQPDLPESSALPISSTTTTGSSTRTLASPFTTTDSGTGTPTATGDSSSLGTKKSNAGPIAGGVVGGIAGLAVVGLAVFFVLRYRRGSAAASSGIHGRQPSLGTYVYYGTSTHTSERSPVAPSVSTHRLYVRDHSFPHSRFVLDSKLDFIRMQNPNDPRTFPTTQDPYGSQTREASTGYLSSDASAAVVNTSFSDGHRGGGVTTQHNPYHGTPEL